MNIKLSKSRIFRDKSGKVVIGQRPNWPLYVWLFGVIGSKVIKNGSMHAAFKSVGFAAIIYWSLLEIFQGVNYFRRFLGLTILLLTMFGKFIH